VRYFWSMYKAVHFYRQEKKLENPFANLKQQELIDKVHETFDSWGDRLNGERYHGGNEFGPD